MIVISEWKDIRGMLKVTNDMFDTKTCIHGLSGETNDTSIHQNPVIGGADTHLCCIHFQKHLLCLSYSLRYTLEWWK